MRRLGKPDFSAPPGIELSRTGGVRGWQSSAEQLVVLKENFRHWARAAQSGKCAFCLLPLGHEAARRGEDIDHFAPKENYPQWTFEVLNFVLSCSSCNQHFKYRYDPVRLTSITGLKQPYSTVAFNLVHPYLDDVSVHLAGGYRRIDERPSPIRGLDGKGNESIKLFGLASPELLQLWKDEYRLVKFRRLPTLLQRLYDRILDAL